MSINQLRYGCKRLIIYFMNENRLKPEYGYQMDLNHFVSYFQLYFIDPSGHFLLNTFTFLKNSFLILKLL